MSSLAILQSLKESILSQASVKAIYGEPPQPPFPTFDPVHFNRNRPGALLARLSECLLIHAVLVRLSILGWGATEEELRK